MNNEISEDTVADAVDMLDSMFPQDTAILESTLVGKEVIRLRDELLAMTWEKIELKQAPLPDDVDKAAKLSPQEVDMFFSRLLAITN